MPELVTIQDVYEALKRIEEKMATREDVEALIDSVKELREFRDAETEEEFLTRMKRRAANVVP